MISVAWSALLAATAFAVVAYASVTVAFRCLSRLQLRGWADSTYQSSDRGATRITELETSLIAVRLSRQLAVLSMTLCATVSLLEPSIGWSVIPAFALVIGFYLLFDKAIPYALVQLIGPISVLGGCGIVIMLARLLLGPAARLLHGAVRSNRARSLAEEAEPRPGDLAAFLDLAEEEGVVGYQEEELLRGVAQLGEAVVREVMRPGRIWRIYEGSSPRRAFPVSLLCETIWTMLLGSRTSRI